jgi:hypothetical protein
VKFGDRPSTIDRSGEREGGVFTNVLLCAVKVGRMSRRKNMIVDSTLEVRIYLLTKFTSGYMKPCAWGRMKWLWCK